MTIQAIAITKAYHVGILTIPPAQHFHPPARQFLESHFQNFFSPRKIKKKSTQGVEPDIGRDEEWIGIYKLDGDILNLCYRYKRNDDCVRPTEFKTEGEKPNVSVFYTYKRDND